MQTTIQIDFTESIIFCGYYGDHNATQLSITIPAHMASNDHIYRLAFCLGGAAEAVRTAALTPTGTEVVYDLPSSVTSSRSAAMQLEEYAADDTFVKKSPLIMLMFASSVPNGTEGVDNDAGMVAEVTANTAARHTHTNKEVIDAIETAPPQIYNKYYANDGVEGRVLMDSVQTAVFGAVTDFLPDTAKIIDVSVRYTADDSVTVADVPIFGGYYLRGFVEPIGDLMLLASADSFSFGNQSGAFTVNDATIRPYLRVYATRAANAGAIIRSNGSNTQILGFTVTYII